MFCGADASSARDAHVPLPAVLRLAGGGSRGTRADEGIRPKSAMCWKPFA